MHSIIVDLKYLSFGNVTIYIRWLTNTSTTRKKIVIAKVWVKNGRSTVLLSLYYVFAVCWRKSSMLGKLHLHPTKTIPQGSYS